MIRIVNTILFVLIMTIIFSENDCYSQSIDMDFKSYTKMNIYFIGFGIETYRCFTPENICTTDPVTFRSEQLNTLKKLLNKAHKKGSFHWFYTRFCIKANGGTLLLIDNDGNFLDTENAIMGSIDRKTMSDLESLIHKNKHKKVFSQSRKKHVFLPLLKSMGKKTNKFIKT